MMRCKNCGWLRWVTTTNTSYYCEFVGGKFLGDLSNCCQAWKPITQTNADRIRSMTDEELAWEMQKLMHCNGCKLFRDGKNKCFVSDSTCKDRIVEWLREEYKND